MSCAFPAPAHPPPGRAVHVGGGGRRAGDFLQQRQGRASELAPPEFTAVL